MDKLFAIKTEPKQEGQASIKIFLTVMSLLSHRIFKNMTAVLCGSLDKRLTCNPGDLGLSRTGSFAIRNFVV